MRLEEDLVILIVDDNTEDTELMCAALGDEGFTVNHHRVDTPEELNRALDDHWDLVLCDGALPWMDAIEVLRLVRERHGDLPLVLVSEPVAEEVIAQLMRSGVRDFVPKRNLRLLGPVARRALECSRPLTPVSTFRAPTACNGSKEWRRMCLLLDQLLNEAQETGSSVALVSFDIDRFHRLNYGLGHEQGEQLLRVVGERISKLAGAEDHYLGRIRGDEYFIVMKTADNGSDVEARVARMMASLRRPYLVGGAEINATFSVGVALYPENGQDSAVLLREAEAAMLEAKRNGRGNCRLASCPARRLQGVQMEQELFRALERNQFRLEYQPQVELGTGRLLGLEALLRWDHPVLGSVSPSRFIPLAEESGEITRIGEWVLRSACRDAAAWRRTPGGANVRVAVNFSARQFLDHDVVGLVKQTLDQTGLHPGALDLELTESVLISDAEEAASRLDLFRAMGVRTSVDDFGTGYSSLSYLCRFSLDVLKIDRSFIAELARNTRAESVVSALVDLGRRLGMELIAEGVETEQQADALRAFGCHTAQGFLFGRPVRLEEITALAGRSAV